MSSDRAADLALLARATGYALESLAEVTGADLGRPTPCPGWDLRALLVHLADAAEALTGSARTGDLTPPGPPGPGPSDPVAAARDRLLVLLDAASSAGDGTAARAAAVEVAAHGWDVGRACGPARPMPPRLAADLLAVATSSLPDALRPVLFAAPVDLPATAPAEDRLVAFLGRRPAASPVSGTAS